jgi:hypothetical protein
MGNDAMNFIAGKFVDLRIADDIRRALTPGTIEAVAAGAVGGENPLATLVMCSLGFFGTSLLGIANRRENNKSQAEEFRAPFCNAMQSHFGTINDFLRLNLCFVWRLIDKLLKRTRMDARRIKTC